LNVLAQKLKGSFFSVMPVVLIVLLLHFTISPIEPVPLFRFLFGALLIIIGLCIFQFGVDISIGPIGQLMGASVAKTNRIWIVVIAGILLGFFISVAEPDLHILADQVDASTSGLIPKLSILLVVSAGIALLLSFGLFRIFYSLPLNLILTGLYLLVLILSFFTSQEFLAISFDASGATTGALTVPFILSLALGASAMKKDSKASEKDSFGLVAITSTGAIIAVMLMSIIKNTTRITGSLEDGASAAGGLLGPFLEILPEMALDILLALLPIIALFLIFQKVSFKLPKNRRRRILMGLLYSFLGLVLLLTGVNAGFMDVGALVGYNIASDGSNGYLVGVGFLLGFMTVLAEPAVHALTNQIETVTSGYVRKRTILTALCIGTGIAIALSMLRVVIPGLKLWHILLPGYIIAIALSFIVPKLFVGIAFDSGGVASGPMTATFILAFAQGAAEGMSGANIMLDGFGVIALVALTPLITLQILGLIYKVKSRKGGMEKNGANA
jgi:Protein of unknown function (DUF1538).